MTIIDQIVIYFLLGTIWGWWIEWFTTKEHIGPRWNNIERIFQLLTWPYNLAIFLYTWIKAAFNDEEE